MNYRAWLWQLLMLTLLALGQAKRPLTVALKNFSCAALVPAITNEFSCIFNRKRNDPSMSVRFKLNEAVKQFSVLVDFDILKRDNTKMSVAHIKLDGCQYLRSAFKNNFYGKIFTRLQKVSNLPKSCPVQANKLFEIRNYTITLDKIPVAMPALTYHVRLKILKFDEKIGDVFIEAAVVN
ncbi:uncharacterized protein LOC135430412 [Drosophila montana]|uniref:uncharacterized protein LOC135430412 n=1 Tax=Drosophila montana TaxID=40370 RepID=UPI00313DB6A4